MGLEDKLKGYNSSVVTGQLTGLAATAAGVLNADRIAKYIPGVDSLLQKTYNAFGYTIAPYILESFITGSSYALATKGYRRGYSPS
jgi:hypothetical protein